MTDYDPASRPSRAAWKNRYGMQDHAARQVSDLERREKILQDYRDQLGADCGHGLRKRVVGQSGDGHYWGGLACPVDNPGCGIKFVSGAQIFQEWKAGQP
jgi:hypothetical protein